MQRGAPDRARPRHRADRLRAVRLRRLLARTDLGALDRADRGRPAPCRHVTLADEISQRCRVLCEKSGFAENFDAETGTGLRDRACTWTAASYLIFAAAAEQRLKGK
ncbi:hypothetical protein Areg01_76690 [Actinoplanes regularis]|nr:hypothetical protein Areg01_76690 [Actinoplanes regularis]